MKIRTGFVSNSSSSSFICDVCGHDESGWDLGLSEAYMSECGRGHIICDSHIKMAVEAEDFDRYRVCSSICPCCQLDNPTDHAIISYLLYKYEKTLKEVKEEIKDTFNTADELYETIK
ncbi:MAG: hypothetical protein ACXAC5_05280 [Promethearchaeota archaeon]|jgi:hypothetical protein